MEEIGRGDFVSFGHVVAGEEATSGRSVMVDALDLQPSGKDSILGHKLNLLRFRLASTTCPRRSAWDTLRLLPMRLRKR